MIFSDDSGGATNTTETDFLSPAEFARSTGISLPTVRRYLKTGRLPKVQPGGHRCRVLIPRDALSGYQAESDSAGENTAVEDKSQVSDSQNYSSQSLSSLSGPVPHWMKNTNIN